jgi:antirestriction protein ArdC
METQTTASENGIARKDVYGIITDKIIEQLNKGTVPWQRPWTGAGMPQNLISQRAYRGVNTMLLAMLGYEQNYFLTYKQIQAIGGKVKRDEKGHMVVYWNFAEKDAANKDPEEETTAKKRAILRYYVVFNVAQCENLPEDKLPKMADNEFDPIATCEKVIEEMPNKPRILHKENRAYYDPLHDFVNMPKEKSFKSSAGYYNTLYHELIHSTGHHSRLAREGLIQMTEFGSKPYSLEELVAEIGACYLQSYCGIETEFDNSVAYVQGWLNQLENNRRFIFTAAKMAQDAIDYILDAHHEQEDKVEEE